MVLSKSWGMWVKVLVWDAAMNSRTRHKQVEWMNKTYLKVKVNTRGSAGMLDSELHPTRFDGSSLCMTRRHKSGV